MIAPLLFVFLGMLLLGMVRGKQCSRMWNLRQETVDKWDQSYVIVEGTVREISEKEKVYSIILEENMVEHERKIEMGLDKIPAIQVFLSKERDTEVVEILKIGQLVRAEGQLTAFEAPRNPGEFDSKSYYKALLIDCRLEAENLVVVDGSYTPLPQLLYSIRRYAANRINSLAEPEDAGVFCAAVLGDKTGLDQDIKKLYQKNGIAHLLAISGLHMSFMGMGLYKIFRRIGLGFLGSGVTGAAMIFCYGILTGSQPSVVRAGIMLSLGFLASWAGRTYDLLSAVSLAALILVYSNPFLLTQGGVQLSFGAVLAIGTAGPILKKWLGDGKIAGTVSASMGIQIITLPIVLYHFYQVPVYGILLNFLVIPLMGGVLCSGLLIIFLGGIMPLLGVGAAGAGHYILELYQWLCLQTEILPYHNVVLGRPSALRIGLYSVVVFCILYGVSRTGKAEIEENQKKTRVYIYRYFLMALCYCTAILCFRPVPVKDLRTVFLDVGQGDGILLQHGTHTVLVDCGSTSNKGLGEYTLEPFLKYYGISSIDYSFISHGDEDHISGIKYLLEHSEDIKIKVLLLPWHGRENESLIRLKELAEQKGTQVDYVKTGDKFTAGNLGITCLYPGEEDVPSDANEESLVLKMDYGDLHMLFTGDMSIQGEERLLQYMQDTKTKSVSSPLSPINLLKVAHHGSKTSSSESFLQAMNLRWAVISCKEDNSYGHPHKEVTDRLKNQKITTLMTQTSGALLLESDGREIRFDTCIDGPDFSQYNKNQE